MLKTNPMKQNYLTILAILCIGIAHAQSFIEFDFDNATVNGGTITQDIFLNGDGYRVTVVHGAAAGAVVNAITGTDKYFYGSTGSRPQQNWTISLIKNGQTENFNFVSVDYRNTSSNSNHTMLVADVNNNLISNQIAISPGNTGAFMVDNAANATNLSTARIVGLTFTATFDVYFNNLRILPISLLSNNDFTKQQIKHYQPSKDVLVFEGDTLERANISIVNLQGQQVFNVAATSNSFTVNTASWNQGLYIATVENNGFVEVVKFVL